MRRLSRIAGWCLGGHTVRQDKPNWLGGLVVVLILSLVGAWMDQYDRKLSQKAETAAAVKDKSLLEAKSAVRESFPSVVIEGKDFRCSQFHIRAEWSLVVGQKCQELAALIRMARAAP